MGVTRILDLIVLVLLATVILMPRPDASVKPALTLDPERRARIAELQSTLIGRPDAVDASVELANIYLDGHRPDWALVTVTAAAKYHPNDYRVHHLRAIAYADRFEGEPAFAAAQRAFELCDATPPPAGAPACGDAARSRLALLSSTLEQVAKVDMKKQPYLAKERIFKALHLTYILKPKAPAVKVAPAAKPVRAPAPTK
jgi:Flp pilus assembly protein TadD